MNVYPIKFKPILKEKVWGGSKLGELLNKNTHSNNVGESWEISGVQDNVSVVENGAYANQSLNHLLSNFTEEFLGVENALTFGENFPLLIKFLDAKTNLSVQVHPDDAMADKHHDSFGKTEMWYIMDSDSDAKIVNGLKDKNFDIQSLAKINATNVFDVFKTEEVAKGDSYFIPAGKIHAIGAGVMAAEIQQTSDITYRVYDWDRPDDAGNLRELHTNLAIAATKKFEDNGKKTFELKNNTDANLVQCNYFTTNIFDVKSYNKRDFRKLDSFVIFMCVEGSASVTTNNSSEQMNIGDTVLIPATAKEAIFKGSSAKFLEVYISSKNSNYPKTAS